MSCAEVPLRAACQPSPLASVAHDCSETASIRASPLPTGNGTAGAVASEGAEEQLSYLLLLWLERQAEMVPTCQNCQNSLTSQLSMAEACRVEQHSGVCNKA